MGERGSGNCGNSIAQTASKAGDAKRIAPRESRLWMPRPDRRKGYRPSAAFRSASFALRYATQSPHSMTFASGLRRFMM